MLLGCLIEIENFVKFVNKILIIINISKKLFEIIVKIGWNVVKIVENFVKMIVGIENMTKIV